MSRQNNGRVAIPLKDVWFVLWNRKKIIALIILFFVAVGATYATISNLQAKLHPRYVTSAAIAVISETQAGNFGENSENPSYDDVLMAQRIADSVVYVVTSDKVIDYVIDDLKLKQTQSQELKDAISAEQYESSQIITIKLRWYDPEEGVEILNSLTEILPDVLIEALKIGNAKIVDFPRAAVLEEGVNVYLVIGIAFAIGLLAGVIFYLLLLIFRPTFLSGEDLEEVLNLPILGEVNSDKELRAMVPYELIGKGEQILSGQFIEQTAFCTHVLQNILDKTEQKIVFTTSTLANEGKSTFAAITAWQLSLLKKKVLIVDLDTRKPSLGKYFVERLDREKTINAVANGSVSVEDACTVVNEYLTILPGFLERKRVRIDGDIVEKLVDLSEKYDYVVIDCPPVGLVSDIMLLKQLSGQAIIVVEQDKAWQGMVVDCANRLEKSGITILGTVLNKVNTRTPANRYYYRNYGGDYYYGSTPKKKVRTKSEFKKAKKSKKDIE